MNWKEYVENNLNQTEGSTKFHLSLPVSEESLIDLKSRFGLSELPKDLEELYRQSDGIHEIMDETKLWNLIGSVEEVIEMNETQRSDPGYKDCFMSFDELFFFSGTAGNGDLFGFVVLHGKFVKSDVYVWNHEDDSRYWVAPDLIKFVEWWTNGKIKV